MEDNSNDKTDDREEILANLVPELRRGTLVLSVLSQLTEPVYGYSLVQELARKGVEAEANTLYPLLRRLEKQGLVLSQWETTSNKPRKYYMRNLKGTAVYEELKIQWTEMVNSVTALLEQEKKNG